MKNNNIQPDRDTKLWQAALYIRLSREDEGEKEESYSISSQREILKEYVRQHPDISIYDIYADDGYSGTNFNRPAFKRMMEDINSGLINCVIVKDLSRFCRNAVDGGYYLDNVFTSLQIRFISVNNCLDTFSSSMNASTRCITMGVQNVINESVAATTSVNVRGTLNMTREKGQFIGSFACYGYIKDPLDHHKLIIDEDAAKIVKMIFSLFLEGKSVLGIAKYLNERSIPNPSGYKKLKGSKYNHPQKDDSFLWHDSSVRRILQNEIYTGTMVQGKTTTISYKIKKCRAVPKEDWIVVSDTHEAIIDKESFSLAQKLFNKGIRSNKSFEQDLFSGLLKCGCCKRALNKKVNIHPYGTYVYYKCPTAKLNSLSSCKGISIRQDKLEEAVLKTLQKIIDLSLSMDEIIKEINKDPAKKEENDLILASIKELKEKKEQLEKMKLSLYPDWKEGILTKEEYLKLKADINSKIDEISKREEKLESSLNEEGKENKFIEIFKRQGKLYKLTRPILLELVDEILIFEDKTIEISFKFKDELALAQSFIKENTKTA